MEAIVVVEKSRRISMHAFSLRSMRYASRMFYTCLSKETGIPQSSVYRILHHELHLFPYKFQLSQAITENHKELRVSFTQFLLENIDLSRQILLSDEANYFSLEGHVHRNNCRPYHLGV